MSNSKAYAPVVVFTYSRLSHLKKTIEALKSNYLAPYTDVFVVSDGPKNKDAEESVKAIRDYVDDIDGFKSLNKIYRSENLGAFESIVDAESRVVSDFGRVICMEDDIVTSNNFLDFINAGLDHFEFNEKIATVAGYCHPISVEQDFDSWLSMWHCPWGYGTWKKRHAKFDYNYNPYLELVANRAHNKSLRNYGDFFIDTLISDLQGKLLAMDARICGQMLLNDMFTVMPAVSKVQNIGCDGSGLHSGVTDKFIVGIDQSGVRDFKFNPNFDAGSISFRSYTEFMNGNIFDRLGRGLRRNIRGNYATRFVKNLIEGGYLGKRN